MHVYPIPHAVTQAQVQLVADQTEKAPSHIIQRDVLNVVAARNEATRQALAEAERTSEAPTDEHVDVKA